MVASMGMYKGEQGTYNVGDYVLVKSMYYIRLAPTISAFVQTGSEPVHFVPPCPEGVVGLIMDKVVIQNQRDDDAELLLPDFLDSAEPTVRNHWRRLYKVRPNWNLIYYVLVGVDAVGWTSSFVLSPLSGQQDPWARLPPGKHPRVYTAREIRTIS